MNVNEVLDTTPTKFNKNRNIIEGTYVKLNENCEKNSLGN
jgi:hypothetical protein